MVQRTVLHETGQRLLRSKLRLDQREAGEAVAHAVLTNEGGVSPLVGSDSRLFDEPDEPDEPGQLDTPTFSLRGVQDGPWASHDFTSLAGAGLHEQMVAAFEQFYHPGGLPECRHEAVAVAVAEAEVGTDTAQKKAVAFSEVLSDEHTALDSRRQHGLALPRARLHSVEAGVAAGLHEQISAAFEQFYHPSGLPECVVDEADASVTARLTLVSCGLHTVAPHGQVPAGRQEAQAVVVSLEQSARREEPRAKSWQPQRIERGFTRGV